MLSVSGWILMKENIVVSNEVSTAQMSRHYQISYVYQYVLNQAIAEIMLPGGSIIRAAPFSKT